MCGSVLVNFPVNCVLCIVCVSFPSTRIAIPSCSSDICLPVFVWIVMLVISSPMVKSLNGMVNVYVYVPSVFVVMVLLL